MCECAAAGPLGVLYVVFLLSLVFFSFPGIYLYLFIFVSSLLCSYFVAVVELELLPCPHGHATPDPRSLAFFGKGAKNIEWPHAAPYAFEG